MYPPPKNGEDLMSVVRSSVFDTVISDTDYRRTSIFSQQANRKFNNFSKDQFFDKRMMSLTNVPSTARDSL